MASAEIDVFKREVLERGGKLAEELRAGKEPDDAAALREVMNTVGKAGRLGESIRCVVSVSMLTEGWDANTVTHVLGVRAFGTQLLCEQVIGRALRRQSYELNNDGLFNVECADVLGIPFDFNAEPVVAPPQKPREALADTACERITAGIVRAELAKDRPIQAVLDRTTRPTARGAWASTPPRPSAGKPMPAAAMSIGLCSTASGKPSSAAWPNSIRACVPA